MLRRLYTAASVLSLLLCVGILAFWVRSYWTSWMWERDQVAPDFSARQTELFYATGQIGWSEFDVPAHRPRGLSIPPGTSTKIIKWRISPRKGLPYWFAFEREHDNVVGTTIVFAGFEFRRRHGLWTYGTGEFVDAAITVPLWALVVLLLIVPTWRVAKSIRQHAGKGCTRCRKCSYDLRANKDRCPECGTPIPAASWSGAGWDQTQR